MERVGGRVIWSQDKKKNEADKAGCKMTKEVGQPSDLLVTGLTAMRIILYTHI